VDRADVSGIEKRMIYEAASSETSACPNTTWLFTFTVARTYDVTLLRIKAYKSVNWTPLLLLKVFARVPAVVMATEIVT